MPIRPQHRWLYPIDWPQISQHIRFGRAKGCCEGCGRPHGQIVCHLGDGRWWDAKQQCWRDGQGRPLRKKVPLPPEPDHSLRTRVILATAHLDNNPSNNDFRNLRALCQRCHLMHDRPEHLRRRRIRFLMTRALGDLFERTYKGT